VNVLQDIPNKDKINVNAPMDKYLILLKMPVLLLPPLVLSLTPLE
jgi:hypothetical protein